MSRSYLSLPPALQAVWRDVYAIAWGHNAYQDTESNPKHAHERAEEAAWEAVRRANGGEMPGASKCPDCEVGARVVDDCAACGGPIYATCETCGGKPTERQPAAKVKPCPRCGGNGIEPMGAGVGPCGDLCNRCNGSKVVEVSDG